MTGSGGMLPRVKPEPQPNRLDEQWDPRPEGEAELRAAIDAAERDALLSPEAFLRWLEGHGEESEKPD